MVAPVVAQQAKSGMRQLKPGEILFNDGEVADSLYIIQKGQIRLFKPKGKGFVEIGILRAGEVIGEMAYFDEDGSGKKRSCSASALTPVEIIEISFIAFGKTMLTLNPWFKTIINTLVTRLRRANTRTKELEDNQTSLSYGGGVKHATYEFMKPIEVMRILGTLFLVFKAHGEVKDQALMVSRRSLTLYTNDMYQIMEVKLESIMTLLVELGWMELQDDENLNPNVLLLKNMEGLRQVFIFYNTERHLSDEKKLRVSEKCEMVIAKVIEKGAGLICDIPNLRIIDDVPPKFTKYYLLSLILEEFKAKNISVSYESLSDAKNLGLFGEPTMIDGKTFIEVDFPKILKMYPVIRFMNAIRKSNIEKGAAT
ncbi:MAG TPA: cyclic nucleotide-binding domain-containing protein [Bacteriovoracaceae bacterium]|nr:cyclic nucleotide-binding domain-containing protein [Bacteriovoracaceae bacterium]